MCDIIELRQKTYLDMLDKLDKYGKCALIRCTGFGKTWMLSELITHYSKVLYLYPSKVVASTVLDRYQEFEDDEFRENFKKVAYSESGNPVSIDNVEFMTYNKLIRLTKKELKKYENFDLIICDECHRIGAKNTRKSLNDLLGYCKSTHFVGATATPERGDAVDVINEFFDDIVVFEYTIHDAFKDGILKKPYYCFCTYDIISTLRKDLKKEALVTGQKMNDLKVTEVINNNLIEISSIFNMENIIREVCNKYAKSTEYMKFIVFFSNMKHLHDKGSDVEKWFKDAYPSHTVNSLTITSENHTTQNNVDKLNDLSLKNNTIDLVFCIDMLNMGYHVKDLTGIVMYRGTESGIIYTQQLGRALNTGSENSSIVFDVVDNIHRKAVYELYDKTYNNRQVRKSPMLKSEKQEIDVADLTNNEISEISSVLSSSLEEGQVKWWKFCNHVRPEDLIAVGNEASYKELIAKLVAEPKVQSARLAFEGYFRRWCIYNGIPYPTNHTEFMKYLDADRDTFLSYVEEMCKKYGVKYPISRKWLTEKIGSGMSLETFAKSRRIEVIDVLKELGVV